MCIFFFIIGDENYPTTLCNNRDEYFSRSTSRGTFYAENNRTPADLNHFPKSKRHIHYVPFDLEAGGTWFSVDSLYDADREGVRFAVVLNLDNNSVPTIASFTELKSRGGLVRNFLALDPQSRTAAEEYAQEVYHQRNQFRPFNLIISDGFGNAFYITSSLYQSTGPERLATGQLYGISNGYLHDNNWEKVQRGKELLSSFIYSSPALEYHMSTDQLAMYVESKPEEDTVQLRKFPQFASVKLKDLTEKSSVLLPLLFPLQPNLQHYIQNLYTVMSDGLSCRDPDYGYAHLPLVQLASVFAKPIFINPSISLASVMSLSSAISTEEFVSTATTTARVVSSHEMLKEEATRTEAEVPALVRNRYHFLLRPSEPSTRDSFMPSSSPSLLSPEAAVSSTSISLPPHATVSNAQDPRFIFGTRTITLFVHESARFLRAQHERSRPKVEDAVEKVTSIDDGRFVLIEDDIQMVPDQGEWIQTHDVNCFDNLLQGGPAIKA